MPTLAAWGWYCVGVALRGGGTALGWYCRGQQGTVKYSEGRLTSTARGLYTSDGHGRRHRPSHAPATPRRASRPLPSVAPLVHDHHSLVGVITREHGALRGAPCLA